MCTAYLNNVHKHAGAHLRAIINKIFNTQEFYRCVQSRNSTAPEKQLARMHLADIASFKDIISNANSYEDIILLR